MDNGTSSDQDSSTASSSSLVIVSDSDEGVVVVSSENPKVVEWEELEQELARLWSLSSALKKAKEKKESLALRLESFIKVREEYLRQSNELEDMSEKLEAKRLAVGDMSMYKKKTLEDVKNQRNQLCGSIRSLLVGGKTLSAAHQQLQEANKLLAGERGHGNLKNLQKMLRRRQQYMITQVSTLYPVKALNDSKEKSADRSGDVTGSSILSLSKPQQPLHLTISGLQLTALPHKKTSFFSNKTEIQRSAVVLGYIAHAVFLIASYLDVCLRYPLRWGGSRSYIIDHAPSVESESTDLVMSPTTGSYAKSTEFPLFLEGQDSTRAAYAIFLLNKDLEQLLNYTNAESLGPHHVLANLKELVRIVQSPQFVDEHR